MTSFIALLLIVVPFALLGALVFVAIVVIGGGADRTRK
jgi:hypothetical protein